MNNEQEIDKMARLLAHSIGDMTCGERAGYLRTRGIGDRKQAVKEFCEKLKENYAQYIVCDDGIVYSVVLEKKIDELFTELYGVDN